MNTQQRDAAWAGVLATVNTLISQQPGAYQQGHRWFTPHGFSRTEAHYGEGAIGTTLRVGQPDGTSSTYEIRVAIEERDA